MLVLCAACTGALAFAADQPPSAASTQPAISDRQASILLQLADAEANIKVINQALMRTGYKVGQSYDRIENSQKANELMDRKGGGPVRWDEFYGKTARDFYAARNVGAYHAQGIGYSADARIATGYQPMPRPPQLDFIYRANDDQIAKARGQIASLMQDQSALLARRHQHEDDQCMLWAELTWEPVRDREIAFRPIDRFALKGDAARVALLRGPILFLRTANQAVVDGLDYIQADQAGTFNDLRARTKSAYAALQETMSTAVLAPNLSATDARAAGDLKDDCKQIAEECLVIDDNYRKAADSDRANEDGSKLEYRSQLQSSAAKLGTLIGNLDDQVSKTAADWQIAPQEGVLTPDKLPPFKHESEPSLPGHAQLQDAAPAPASKAPPAADIGPNLVPPTAPKPPTAQMQWRPADGKWVRRWTGKGSNLNKGLVIQTYDVFGGGTRVKAYSWNLPLVRERDGSLSIEYTHFFQLFTKTGSGIIIRQWKKRADYDAGKEATYDGVFEHDAEHSE
jgi:hypothetical protein